MIRMTNINKQGDIITLDCHSDEAYPNEQSYKLAFNAETKEILSKPENAEMSDIAKIIYKLRKYLSNGISLPAKDCIACF